MCDLVDELQRAKAGHEIVLESLVAQILVYLFRHCLEPTMDGPRQELAPQLPAWESIRAMHYMSSHGKRDFSLAGLCAEIGSS